MTDCFDHPWLGGLFGDDEMRALWSPQAQLEGMRRFEAAWSRALGQAGMADTGQAEQAARAIEGMQFDLADLRTGTAHDGVVVPALVRQMKAAAGDAAAAVHQGATSQDVIDTALVLAIKPGLALLDQQLAQLQTALRKLDTQFGTRPLIGRTRMQAATPITVGDRIASWALPLDNHRERLAQLAPRILLVQIGGASGNRADLGDKAEAVTSYMARLLNLGNPPRAWHSMRDGVGEFASLLSLISGSLGKIGQDIALMAQQGISEVTLSGGGGSSAMPHKQNPVLAELLVSLARFNAVQVSAMHQSLVHEQERSGAAWALEWMVLPQMAQASARSLSAALTLCGMITAMGDPE